MRYIGAPRTGDSQGEVLAIRWPRTTAKMRIPLARSRRQSRADTQIRYRMRPADRKVLPSSGPPNSGPSGAVDAPRRIGPDLQSGLRDGCAAVDADPELAVVEPGHRLGDVLQPGT